MEYEEFYYTNKVRQVNSLRLFCRSLILIRLFRISVHCIVCMLFPDSPSHNMEIALLPLIEVIPLLQMKNNLRLKPSIVTTSRGQHVTAEALPGSDSSSLLRSSSKTPPLQQQQQQLDATSSYPEQ